MTMARVFLPFALGYFLSYLVRVVNAVIGPDLVAELQFDAAELGLLTSAYFLAFALFQVPLGILLDRYGPRRTESVLLIIAAAGAFAFASATSLSGLLVGRALIGLGVSSCLMAALKAYGMWFEKDRLPMINGFHMAAGGMGALVGTIPVEHALQVTDWRGVMMIISAIALTAALTIFFVVPNRGSSETSSDTLRSQIAALSQIYKSPAFWRIVPLCVTTQCSFLAIQTLWSGPWLSDVAGLSRDTTADYLFWVACAMVSGFIGLGYMAAWVNRWGISTLNFGILAMALFIVVQVAMVFQWIEFTLIIWLLFGFFGTAGIIPFAVLPHLFPAGLAGRVITSVNLLIFLAAFAAQWGIGAIINLWPLTAAGGYAPEGFQASFAVILGLQVLGLAWCGLYKGERA
ncbi:MAG: MFS transporter [Rhodospirillales bacterium]|nr:MFS transporter [Rhodospirillales bacterium]